MDIQWCVTCVYPKHTLEYYWKNQAAPATNSASPNIETWGRIMILESNSGGSRNAEYETYASHSTRDSSCQHDHCWQPQHFWMKEYLMRHSGLNDLNAQHSGHWAQHLAHYSGLNETKISVYHFWIFGVVFPSCQIFPMQSMMEMLHAKYNGNATVWCKA